MYEPLAFLLLGSVIGLIFTVPIKIITLPLRRLLRSDSDRERLETAFSVFLIVAIVGAFFANKVMIHGGYIFSIPGNIMTICIATIIAGVAFLKHHALTIRNRKRLGYMHLSLIVLAFVYIGAVTQWHRESDHDLAVQPKGVWKPSSNSAAAPGTPEEEIDNVIIVLLDAMRASHLSLYGYHRTTSPNIDRWAQREGSVVFENAYTPKTKTSPAVASLFTGLYPHTHGIYLCAQQLRGELTTLAETFRGEGFSTAALVANSNITEKFNFHQGFDHHEHFASSTKVQAGDLVDESINWLSNVDNGENFFFYIHFLDTHAPYYDLPPEYVTLFLSDEHSREFEELEISVGTTYFGHIRDEIVLEGHETDIDYYVSLYDSEIRYFDCEIQRLFDYLDTSGLSRNTLVIFTSDHGESLTEHNFFFAHGSFAYDPTARIPLILHHPSFGEARRIDAIISLIDLAPTIVNLLDLDAPVKFDGISLRSVVRNRVDRPEYAYILGGDRHEWVTLHAVTDERWKLIYNPLGLSRTGIYNIFNTFYPRYKTEWLSRKREFKDALLEYQLYDLQDDPGETKNVFSRSREVADHLKEVLFSKYYRPVRDAHELDVEHETLDEQTLEHLRALGYMQ